MTRRAAAPLRRAAAPLRRAARPLAALGAASVAMLALGGAESLRAATPSDSPTGVQSEVMFADYSPLARSAELMRRLLSPLTALQVRRQSAGSGRPLREQPIDLESEKFTVYVPSQTPAKGYALLVFVPPWREAVVPPHWTAALDRHGMIFVSASNSGNDADVLDRREPLALLAAYNVMRRYPVDSERVYIGGFSGGSRVAIRLAVAYPDVFHAALLNAGSDSIGDGRIPLPEGELFRRFQDSSRLVYLTGQDDSAGLDQDVRSRQSMQEWCAFDLQTQLMLRAGHETAGAAALDRALDALADRQRPDPQRLAACRARVAARLAESLERARNLQQRGKSGEAWSSLKKIDTRYGGLAAPDTLDLARQIDVASH
jgi:dienelactone hydrolase